MTDKLQRKFTNAYNEFVAEFCERHTQCRATRDEAHEIAGRAAEMGKELGIFGAKWRVDAAVMENMVEYLEDPAEDVIHAAMWLSYEEAGK